MRCKNWASLVVVLGLLIGMGGPVPMEDRVAQAKEPSLPRSPAGDSVSGTSTEAVADRSPANPLQFQAGRYIAGVLPEPTTDFKYRWHTFYGSGDSHSPAYALAVDGSADVFVAGYSGAWDGPDGQPPLNAHSGGAYSDVVVLKLDSSGTYQWHTFYGSGSDGAYALALDSGGVCVAGESGATWDGPGGQAPLHDHSGNWDLVVLKLDGSGTYQWHTFYPGQALALALDSSGDLYVAGLSYATWLGPGGEAPLHPHSGDQNLMVLKLNGNGAYQWHTFYGSSDYHGHLADGLALDGSGDVYVAGFSETTWNGPEGQTPLHAHSGGYSDLVMLKLDGSGTYQWHTFYGSGTSNSAKALAVDGSSDVYVAGDSETTWDGPGGQTPLHPHSGGYSDLVVLKLTNNGAYQWHTFHGSGTSDLSEALVVDGNRGVYVAGFSEATWDGPGGQAPLHAHTGYRDLVVLKLVGNGAYQWHAFYGSGSAPDWAYALAADGSGGVYVAGDGSGTWDGPRGQAPLHAHSEGWDLVVLKLYDRALYLPLVLRNHRTWDSYYEENDHWLAAYGPLTFGQAYQAYPDDADDYYYFQLSSTTTVNIRVEQFAPTSTYGDLLLYGPATGDQRGPRITYFGQPGHSSMVLDPQSLGPGKYYVRVYVADSNYYSTSDLYTLTVSH